MEAPPMADEGNSPLKDAQLMELYKIAVEEYRFQVNLNASRSRDFLVLNSAIIAAGVTLLGQKASLLSGLVFVVGFCVATLAALATRTQHNYYREARDTKKLLEHRLGISGVVVKTTPSTGSRRRRLGSVTGFNYTILILLCGVNIVGTLVSFSILPFPIQKSRKPVPIHSSPSGIQRQSVPLTPGTTAQPGKPQAPVPRNP